MATKYDIKTEFLKEDVLETLREISHPVDVAVFGSENCWNFGAIIRTAHNFLARDLYAIDMDWYYKRASMTAHQWQKQNIHMISMDDFLERTRERNIVAFERRETLDSRDLRTFEFPEYPILLFGSEKFGVPDRLLARANHVVSIPVFGFVLDYNIATATGIALYDFTNKLYRGNTKK